MPPLGDKKVKTPLDDAVDRGLAYRRQPGPRRRWAAGYRGKTGDRPLGVMAFMSAGHIPGEGKYGDHIKLGISTCCERRLTG